MKVKCETLQSYHWTLLPSADNLHQQTPVEYGDGEAKHLLNELLQVTQNCPYKGEKRWITDFWNKMYWLEIDIYISR